MSMIFNPNKQPEYHIEFDQYVIISGKEYAQVRGLSFDPRKRIEGICDFKFYIEKDSFGIGYTRQEN